MKRAAFDFESVAPAFDAAPPSVRTAAPAPILALEGVSLSFGGVRALNGVSFALEPGRIGALIGPNGAGKSSLVNVMTGLYRPDAGHIRIGDETFARAPTERLAALGVTRTFQNLALFPGLTVRANVATGLTHLRRATALGRIIGSAAARREAAEHDAHVSETLRFLRLEAVADRRVGGLPYGLRKRVDLARALVARPRILLLDEPMAGMTATEKAEMAELVRRANSDLGVAIVLIEHDIGVVMGLSDQIAVLDHGVKIADGAPDAVRRDPRVIAAYLGESEEEAA